jgi:hypothetical protein
MSITGWLFRLARLSADVGALKSGKPKRITRRVKNKLTGRVLSRTGFWARLWK